MLAVISFLTKLSAILKYSKNRFRKGQILGVDGFYP
jgi:hypothetical protein